MRAFDFNRIPGFVAAFRPFLGKRLEDAGNETYKQMIRNWERGQDAKGRPWEAIHPRTAARKGHATPLIHTRDMIDSAEMKVDKHNLQVGITIDAEYAAVHEFGAPDQGIPKRPILAPASDVLAENMHPAIGGAIDQAYRNAGAAGVGMQMGFGSMGGQVRR